MTEHLPRLYRLNAFVFAAIIACTAVRAAEPGEAALGIGASTCNDFMASYEHNPHSEDADHVDTGEGGHRGPVHTSAEYIAWLQGYFSAYSLYENGGVDVTGGASVGAMLYPLYRWCGGRENEPFAAAMPDLIKRLRK